MCACITPILLIYQMHSMHDRCITTLRDKAGGQVECSLDEIPWPWYSTTAVSYTHLDVYKRQHCGSSIFQFYRDTFLYKFRIFLECKELGLVGGGELGL